MYQPSTHQHRSPFCCLLLALIDTHTQSADQRLLTNIIPTTVLEPRQTSKKSYLAHRRYANKTQGAFVPPAPCLPKYSLGQPLFGKVSHPHMGTHVLTQAPAQNDSAWRRCHPHTSATTRALLFKNYIFCQRQEAMEGLNSLRKECLQARCPREENKIKNHKTWAVTNSCRKHRSERYVLFQSFLAESKQDTFSLNAVFLYSLEISLSARVWKEWKLWRTDSRFSFQCLRTPGTSGATRHPRSWPLLPKASQLLGSERLQGELLGAAASCFLLPSHLGLGFPYAMFSDLHLSHDFAVFTRVKHACTGMCDFCCNSFCS